MPEQEEKLSPEEQALLEEALKGYGSPQQDEKHNVHTFLNTVANAKDTTKTGNLSEIEIGSTFYSLRSYKMFSLDSNFINDDIWEEYFKKCGEILPSTSLSKEGFLMRQATTTTKQIADVTPQRIMKENKGWFKRKDNQNMTGGAN